MKKNSKILALKYRPQVFEDLIGQNIICETIINSIKTALCMSFISMISMEISMNLVDWLIMGEAKINLWILPIMLLAGFLTPWPYNYWRLKKFNISCH